jgi:hypothetical protein
MKLNWSSLGFSSFMHLFVLPIEGELISIYFCTAFVFSCYFLVILFLGCSIISVSWLLLAYLFDSVYAFLNGSHHLCGEYFHNLLL